MDEKFELIVVGGGLAGSAAAYRAASAGANVLVIERGHYGGAKNVTGGRMYGHALEKLIPDFTSKGAPIERRIVKERVSMMTATSASTMEYQSARLREPSSASYTISRSKFDKWFSAQAEKVGAVVVNGIRVDDLLVEGSKVCGVVCDGIPVRADAVLLADGVNSLLAQKVGLKKELDPHMIAVGAKEIIRFDEKTINDRFGLAPGEGVCWLLAGHPTGGAIGGGFLYTNKETVAVGVVATVGDVGYTELKVSEMVDLLKEHPTIHPLLEGGRLMEYSAHLVPEGGIAMVPELVGDGVIIAGDAAGFVINFGYTVRGMDFAIESGRLAADAFLAAKSAADYSKASLSRYRELLDDSFVMRDLKHYKNMPALIETRELFNEIPMMVGDLMDGMFVIDGRPPENIIVKAVPAFSKAGGVLKLAKVGMRVLEAM
jgi:electron transfer flavoprotein-quinone oxidoreductase